MTPAPDCEFSLSDDLIHTRTELQLSKEERDRLSAEVERLKREVKAGERNDCNAVDLIHEQEQRIATLQAALKGTEELIAAIDTCPDNGKGPRGSGPEAVHLYECAATKWGKKAGPCDCGGDAIQQRIDAAMTKIRSALAQCAGSQSSGQEGV